MPYLCARSGPSPVHRLGLFASEFIAAGAKVTDYHQNITLAPVMMPSLVAERILPRRAPVGLNRDGLSIKLSNHCRADWAERIVLPRRSAGYT